MRNKTLVLLVACVCGAIAAVGLSHWMQAQSSQGSEIKMVEIFVTTKAIDVAEEITGEKIKLEQWPADRIPEGATSTLDDLEGKYARQRFYAGEPVMPVKLMNDSNGSSQKIPRGYTVVAMEADPENAVANLVRPGDRVDVMGYFKKSDVVPETTAKTILRGVRVFALDGQTQREDNDEATKAAKTISLLIKKTDAEVWTWASELGKIRLTLGNLTDYENDGDREDPGQQFLQWIADHAKANETKEEEVEPAPRTVVTRKVEPTENFKMQKLSGGKITQYGWTGRDDMPHILSETGGDESKAPAAPAATATSPNPQDDEYSYLNGEASPFFQPPAEEAGTADDADDLLGR
ncbi:Flp pilus assembly protein CpaB [Crateriforma conspicua]|uniref:SAF domain protein n=1 Tax=Crateriforma conspicua TaxID=2527996 RepID=A0A5C5YC05_9PLAN|nr:Flp pilus assembly protein CpaB [Crateriforma conspicua]QDV61768.1 SAF domain protein [Crateriforma conspicua]TWT71981.1 SAF domain protein [Crateriforma conspicua]